MIRTITPTVVTWFITHDTAGSVYHCGVIAAGSTFSTGLAELETFTDEAVYRDRLAILGLTDKSPEILDSEEMARIRLAESKIAKRAAIDAKTNKIICGGILFDGKVFDTTPTAQFNWKNMFDLTNAGLLSFPVSTCTIEDEPYAFSDQASVNAFYFAGVQFVTRTLAEGRSVKYLINACTTVEQVNAIVDPR